MPDRKLVEAFVAQVVAGDFVGAIESHYGPAATMQENEAPPRAGRDTLVAHERKVIAAFKDVKASLAGPILIAGDQVAIRWRFEMVPAKGASRVLDEIAWQTWRDGKIVTEKFFYDPAQTAG